MKNSSAKRVYNTFKTPVSDSELRGLIPFYKKTVTWSQEDECFIARTPEIQGCVTHGDTEEEALEHLKEAIEVSLISCKKRKERIPLPASKRRAPASFPLRMAPDLYHKVKDEADEEDVSMNDYISSLIEKGLAKNG